MDKKISRRGAIKKSICLVGGISFGAAWASKALGASWFDYSNGYDPEHPCGDEDALKKRMYCYQTENSENVICDEVEYEPKSLPGNKRGNLQLQLERKRFVSKGCFENFSGYRMPDGRRYMYCIFIDEETLLCEKGTFQARKKDSLDIDTSSRSQKKGLELEDKVNEVEEVENKNISR